VYGEQVKGESTAEFADAVEAGAQNAAEAIENKQVPREYQEAVKRYFGTLGEKVKADRPPAATTPPASPATPATPPATPAK